MCSHHNVQKEELDCRFWRLYEWNRVATCWWWWCVASPDQHTPAVNNSSPPLPSARWISPTNIAVLWRVVNNKLAHARNIFTHQVMSRAPWCTAQLLRNRIVCVLSHLGVKATVRCTQWIPYSPAVWRNGPAGRWGCLEIESVVNLAAGTQRIVGSGWPGRAEERNDAVLFGLFRQLFI